MAVARGDALEWALALAKAPVERVSLRDKALPREGMERLLQIASETSPEVLADAASAAGEPAGDVVDAARFYVREILFHKGADAYRVLGLHRDASQAQVKAHFRLLQQWLHPDRRTSDWDAIFAARVNAAWNHLRTEGKRRDYDLANPPQASDQAASASPVVAWQRQPEYEQPLDPRARWGRRAPLVALVAICGLLGAMALLDSTDDPDRWKDQASVEPEAGSLRGLALAKPVTVDAVEQPVPRHARPPMPSRKIVRPMSKDAAPEPERRAGGVHTAGGGSAPPTAAIATTAARKSDPATATASAEHGIDERPPQAPAPKSVHATAKLAASAAVETVPPRPPQQVAVAPAPAPAPIPVPAADSAPASTNADAPRVSSEQALMAQRVGAQLMAYMNGIGSGTPPIWGSLTTQQGAAALRESLRAAGTKGIEAPRWRVGSREASMRADVRYRDGQAGRLAATMAWRDQRWWVTSLSMERDL